MLRREHDFLLLKHFVVSTRKLSYYGNVMAEKKHNPDEWVDLYGDYLYRYALMRLKDSAAAQDVIQETFLAGFKGLEKFDGRVDIKYWLRGILRNKIVDYIRKAV
ncbi:MAG: DNA-directed RNA polymerase specialized sigma24 family protein, partial [Candidatus Omnitrophota bacterium]